MKPTNGIMGAITDAICKHEAKKGKLTTKCIKHAQKKRRSRILHKGKTPRTSRTHVHIETNIKF